MNQIKLHLTNILKQNKSMLIHKYIDLYPHSSRADCIDCKNECMCRVIQANMQRVDNEQFFKTLRSQKLNIYST